MCARSRGIDFGPAGGAWEARLPEEEGPSASFHVPPVWRRPTPGPPERRRRGRHPGCRPHPRAAVAEPAEAVVPCSAQPAACLRRCLQVASRSELPREAPPSQLTRVERLGCSRLRLSDDFIAQLAERRQGRAAGPGRRRSSLPNLPGPVLSWNYESHSGQYSPLERNCLRQGRRMLTSFTTSTAIHHRSYTDGWGRESIAENLEACALQPTRQEPDAGRAASFEYHRSDCHFARPMEDRQGWQLDCCRPRGSSNYRGCARVRRARVCHHGDCQEEGTMRADYDSEANALSIDLVDASSLGRQRGSWRPGECHLCGRKTGQCGAALSRSGA